MVKFLSPARRLAVMFGLALVPLWAASAYAQIQGPLLGTAIQPSSDRGRNTSVLERERPEYEALGISAGGFRIFPRIELGAGYSSNVYATRLNKIGDALFVIDPSITAESNWNRHALSVSAAGRFRRDATATERDEDGFTFRSDGRLDITRDTSARASLAIDRSYEQPTSGSFPGNALSAIPFYRALISTQLEHQVGRVRAIVAGDVNWLTFENVSSIGGGTLYEKDRDRRAVRGTARGDYALTPDISAFGQFSYTVTNYDRLLANGSANRDGDEVRFVAGGSFDLTALFRGELGLGYTRRRYDASLYRDFGGLAVQARLEYFLTPLTTVTVNGQRFLEDSNTIGLSGFYITSVGVRVDHELLRNVLLNAQIEYDNDRFQQSFRRDHTYSLSGGFRYLANRTLGFSGTVSYLDRSSNDRSANVVFNEVRTLLSVIVQR